MQTLAPTFAALNPTRRLGRFALALSVALVPHALCFALGFFSLRSLDFALRVSILDRFAPSGFVLCTRINAGAVRLHTALRDAPPSSIKKEKKEKKRLPVLGIEPAR